MKFILKSLVDTKHIANLLVNELKLHSEIYLLLKGDLAAGKTTLTKYIVKNLGVNDNVSSPSFVILNQYFSKNIKINHMDCYRLNKDENFALYLEEFDDAINIIEWPNLISNEIKNKKIIELQIDTIDINARKLSIKYNFSLKSDLIKSIKNDFENKD